MRTPYGRKRFGFFPLLMLMALAFVTFVVYWLWNNVLIAVVPVRPVTCWQAIGLLVLSRILFGGFKFGRPGGGLPYAGGPHWREKWRQMSDEERTKFKNEWRRRGEDR